VTAVPTTGPVSAVPRKLRLITTIAATVLVVVFVVVAVLLKESTEGPVSFRTADQVAMAGLGLAIAAGILVLGRSRVDADAEGITVRNIVVTRRLPWSAVRSVRFDQHSPWATLLLSNGDELALLALQANDKQRAVTAVRGLRALLAEEQARTPQPPVQELLYPWE
jgi:hypothetical protein